VLGAIDRLSTSYYGTDMYPAIHKAALALEEAFADLKHMIVLTDGVSHPADFEGLAKQTASCGITITTVGVGREVARPLLEDIARIGQGHFYSCDDMAAVPKIFAMEAATASKRGVVEKPFLAQVVGPSAALGSLDLQHAPTLLGYVQTRAKPTSQVVLATESGEPVLAWWHAGLGTTVAFTSDIESRWAAAWLRWPGFGRFWSQLVRHAMRKDRTKDFRLEAAQDRGRIQATLDAVAPQGRFLNGAEATLKLIEPRHEAREIPVPQVAPGRYATSVPATSQGIYCLEMRLRNGEQSLFIERRAVVIGYADELRTRPTNEALLQHIAEATGGTYDPKPERVFAPSNRAVPRTIPLWPYFLAAAAVILVVDVGARRLPLNRPGQDLAAVTAKFSEESR
jgi:hypothetical protein